MINTLRQIPVIEKCWAYFREKRILYKHKTVAKALRPMVNNYFRGKLPVYQVEKRKDLSSKKIIWQYWGQGIDSPRLPEVVRRCFESVDLYKGDYTVIRLDDNTVNEYIGFPDFVLGKLYNETFGKTFFSDLLRLALLKSYGGIWLDATVLLTGAIPKELSDLEYFVYQRDPLAENKNFWKSSYAYYWNWNKEFKVRMLSSFFVGNPNSKVVQALLDLMLNYWKDMDRLLDYFVFQILYTLVSEEHLHEKKCPTVNDVYPHLLQTKFNGKLENYSYQAILTVSRIHKMSYFDDAAMARMTDFIEKYQDRSK